MNVTRHSKKLILLQCAALLCAGAPAAQAGNVGVNLNINVGEPPRPVVVAPAPAPVYVAPAPPPAPVYVAPPPANYLVVEDDVHFVYPSGLGFYVAVGVPYDLFFVNNSYFLFRDGRWLRAATPRGPWIVQRYRELPPGLRRHRLERIREFRAREYAVYNRDRDHYRGRHFRSDKELWRERREAAREQRKEDHFREKEARKEEHFREKEARKEEKRFEKEQRKEERRQEREERHEHRDGR